MEEIKIGDRVNLKIGRNVFLAEILGILEDGNGFQVKSLSSSREFTVKKSQLLAIHGDGGSAPQDAGDSSASQERKMSLMDAAVEVLRISGTEMNTREMVGRAVELGLWTPTECRTPEQTLYGSIFREIKRNEHPRIVKAGVKGLFKLG